MWLAKANLAAGTMSIDNDTRATIESILTAHPVVLFLNSTRSQALCGFSAKTPAILDTLLPQASEETGGANDAIAA